MLEFKKTHKNYHTLDYYFKTKYGKKVFKVPLNANFTCPNIDGSKGFGGCAFCSGGSGEFAGNPKDSLLVQFEKIKERMLKKWPDSYYIVYFQANSNTYGDIKKLQNTFEGFESLDNVIGMSIATRCDCLNEEIVKYLASLKSKYQEFYVELGLQSANKKTMELLNLGYTIDEFSKAINLLNQYDIDVIVHIIDGLPYETIDDQLKTINFINTLKVKGLKIHILNVLDNTKLGKMYLEGKFKIPSENEFIDIIVKQIASLNEDIIIHRIGADSDDSHLIAPEFIKKKLTLMDKIDLKMKKEAIYQGENITNLN